MKSSLLIDVPSSHLNDNPLKIRKHYFLAVKMRNLPLSVSLLVVFHGICVSDKSDCFDVIINTFVGPLVSEFCFKNIVHQ